MFEHLDLHWIPFSEIHSVLVYILKSLRSPTGENYVHFYCRAAQIYFTTESFFKELLLWSTTQGWVRIFCR